MYLTPTAVEEPELCAAALLQMDAADVTQLARLNFLLSDEVGALLDALPRLVRQLATDSTPEEERSTERVRGAIRWQKTIVARHHTGLPTLTISEPALRIYDTPENRLLVFLLAEIERTAQHLRWPESANGAGATVADRVATAIRWKNARMLASIGAAAPTPRQLSRIRSGRARRRFATVLDAFEVHRSLLQHLNRDALRHTIETRGLATSEDPALFELLCWFGILDALGELGWTLNPHRLIDGRVHIAAQRGDETITAWFRNAPKQLTADNRYGETLAAHGIDRSGLTPDIVLAHESPHAPTQWLLAEAKMGANRRPATLARRALLDLLAYESAYSARVSTQTAPVGLGMVWGAGLEPAPRRIMLATPDRLFSALSMWLGMPEPQPPS